MGRSSTLVSKLSGRLNNSETDDAHDLQSGRDLRGIGRYYPGGLAIGVGEEQIGSASLAEERVAGMRGG